MKSRPVFCYWGINLVLLRLFAETHEPIQAILILALVVHPLQKADADACATPADWRPGDDVIVPTAGSCGVAKERMDNQNENQYCLDWFMCFRKESK